MPTYEYKCHPCGVLLEISHKMDDENPYKCPNCQKTMQKGFGGGIGVHFKGSGWYETDYKGK